jgi:hypothetical protein
MPARKLDNSRLHDGNQITRKDGSRQAGAEDTKTDFFECADNSSSRTLRRRRRHIFPPLPKRLTDEL